MVRADDNENFSVRNWGIYDHLDGQMPYMPNNHPVVYLIVGVLGIVGAAYAIAYILENVK